MLGFSTVAGGDETFRALVLARIIGRAGKATRLRVLEETGVAPPSYRTVNRRLPVYAKEPWRRALSAACAAHAGLGPATLVLSELLDAVFQRPMPVMGSVSRGFLRSGGWNRRSRSGC